jgi:opacity protein-like surface antigen
MRKTVLVVSALSILALAGAASADPISPQPDPPGKAKSKPQDEWYQGSQGKKTPHPGDRPNNRVHAFNPQPDPPGDKHAPHPHASQPR